MQLTRATHALLNDSQRASEIGRAAAQRVASQFSVERMIERHAELYSSLIESR